MSAIAALRVFDGEPIRPERLHAVYARLPGATDDRRDVWTAGSIALVARISGPAGNLPESRAIAHDSASGAVALGIARIDNRTELRARIGVRNSAAMPDVELVLGAYVALGESFVEHVAGDFALVIWDAGKQTLVCARDRFGAQPLCYHHVAGRHAVVGSATLPLLAFGALPRALDERKVADYFCGGLDDGEITYLRGFSRLPPGHVLTIGADGIPRRRSYWKLDPARTLAASTTRSVLESFGARLDEAVRCRLTERGETAIALSGGLDSSAIAASALRACAGSARERLVALSAVGDDPERCPETPYARAAAAALGLRQREIRPSELHASRDMWRAPTECDDPIDLTAGVLHRATHVLARQHGVPVVLDGIDGDFCASYSPAFLARLLLSGRWIALVRSIGFTWPLNTGFPRTLAVYAVHERRRRSPSAATELLDPDFARRIELGHARASLPAAPRTAREDHHLRLASPSVAYGLELVQRSARALGIEVRHPYFDHRLVELTLAMPSHLKIRGGWTKYALRRVTAGVVPDSIRFRRRRASLMSAFTRAHLESQRERLDAILADDWDAVGAFVRRASVEAALRRYDSQSRSEDLALVWSVAALAAWLRALDLAT